MYKSGPKEVVDYLVYMLDSKKGKFKQRIAVDGDLLTVEEAVFCTKKKSADMELIDKFIDIVVALEQIPERQLIVDNKLISTKECLFTTPIATCPTRLEIDSWLDVVNSRLLELSTLILLDGQRLIGDDIVFCTKAESEEPKYGDKVLVRDSLDDDYIEYNFVTKVNAAYYPFIVGKGFSSGGYFLNLTAWRYCIKA